MAVADGGRFGPVAIVWAGDGAGPPVVRILLAPPLTDACASAFRAFPEAMRGTCREVDLLAGAIRAMLAGDDVQPSTDPVDLGMCSPFQRKILLLERTVPRGRVCTYEMLARAAGAPGGARAAGRALATNPFPLVVPCHRAVRSDGSTGGFQGGAGMKRALLEMEGVPLRNGRAAASAYVVGLPGDQAQEASL